MCYPSLSFILSAIVRRVRIAITLLHTHVLGSAILSFDLDTEFAYLVAVCHPEKRFFPVEVVDHGAALDHLEMVMI